MKKKLLKQMSIMQSRPATNMSGTKADIDQDALSKLKQLSEKKRKTFSTKTVT